jgi:hypothetical protein
MTRSSCVATQHRRAGSRRRRQGIEDEADVVVVLVSRGFVEHEQRRGEREGARQTRALLLAQGRPGGGLVGDRLEVEQRQQPVDVRRRGPAPPAAG